MKQIKVLARPGVNVPIEGVRNRYIEGGPIDGDPAQRTAITVTDSAYYQQQIADGDLELAKEEAARPKAEPATTAKPKKESAQ